MLAGVAAASVVALLIGASSASAYWTASGSSTATAASGTTSALTITATVGAASLHPGGLAPLRASVTNPNATAVRVRALELDPTQGDGSGFAVDGGHSGCGTAAFTFRDQVIDQVVPARTGGTDGALALALTDAVGMRLYAPSACQGATVTVALREVASLRTFESQVTASPGPAYRWRMDDASGSTMAAAVGGIAGTYSGSPAFGTAGIVGSSPATAVRFGSGSYAELPGIALDTFSLAFWFSSTAGVGTTGRWYNAAALVDADVPGTQKRDWGVGLRSDGTVVAGVGSSGADLSITSAAGYNDGEWHQVVFTRTTAGAISLFVDGTAAAATTGGWTGPLTDVTRIRIANGTTSAAPLVGAIDEITIATTALTATQVLERYQVGLRGLA